MASIWRDKEYQFQADDGTPLNAGTVQFYTTGTSTPKNTFSDEALTTPNANPVVLDADGRSANNIWISGRYRIVVKTSAGVTIADIDPVEDATPASDFQDGSQIWGGTAGGTATALTFSLTPTITAYTDGMEVGWRWNADTADGGTTINVNGVGAKSLTKRDGTAIAAGDGQQNDVAVAKYNSTQNRFELVTPEGMLYRDGNNALARVDVASAPTVNLDTAGSKYVRITGTDTTTAITLTNGRERKLLAAAAWSITAGASLIIPGVASGATITLAAGDTLEAIGEAAGVVRIHNLTRYANASKSGTFTPDIVGDATAGAATYAANGQKGYYRIEGRLCFVSAYLSWTAHTGTGNLLINNGLPFLSRNQTNQQTVFPVSVNSLTHTANNYLVATALPNSTTVTPLQKNTGVDSLIPMDTAAILVYSGVYEIDPSVTP